MLAALLGSLGTIGPFAVDTYLPAFVGIASSLAASPLQMQQTLSSYLLGIAVMNLFHGALSDGFGRRPVILAGIGVFALASVGCALADNIGTLVAWRVLQGLSGGAGMVVSRAVVRDLFDAVEAQKMMSQMVLFFGVAPALAPAIGGLLFVHLGWASIFWFLAGVSLLLWLSCAAWLPETLPPERRQSLRMGPLLRGYWQLMSSARFVALVLVSVLPFNGFFLYILSSPEWLGTHLQLAPTQFAVYFVLSIGCVMTGAWLCGRLVGRVATRRQVRWGFVIMAVTALGNVVLNLLFTAHVAWALLPVTLYAFGWSLMTPLVTVMLLDLSPQRRGLASSLQTGLGAAINAVVAGVVAPAVMHGTRSLAFAAATLFGGGLLAWLWVQPRLPDRIA
ncbi:MAG: multidrug effflux MFS transporter [Burkholderiaceae bacterium]|nr:multidrug effflux MFS transporter [Burkholderiaceae bacterium]